MYLQMFWCYTVCLFCLMFAWRHSIYLRLHLYIAVCIFLLMCDSFLRSWFIAIDCFLAVYICFVACLEFATLEIVIFLAMCLAFFLFAELTFFICSLRLFTDSCLRCALNFYLLVFHKNYWCYLAYRITLINYCC